MNHELLPIHNGLSSRDPWTWNQIGEVRNCGVELGTLYGNGREGLRATINSWTDYREEIDEGNF